MKPTCAGAESLSAKADLLQRYTEEAMVDANGVVYSSINNRTQKPWTPDDLGPDDEFIPVEGFGAWDVINYENSGMTTGGYLAAQAFRYRSVGDAEALALARRSFEGLCHIYDLGRQKEEGYFPKNYGDRYSEEASTDQYLYAMKGMMAYLPLAASDHADAIRTMIPKMVDFWVSRGYRRDYFAVKDLLWPLGRFPSLLLMAWKVSGQQKYLDEFTRLNEEEKVHLEPADMRLGRRLKSPDQFSDYEERQGRKYLLAHLPDSAAMDIMELDECLTHSEAYAEHWLRSMRQMWHEGLLGLTDGGLDRSFFLYDPQTGEVSAPLPGYTSDSDSLNWSWARWAGGVLSARSTMVARAGVHVAKWLPDENPTETIIKVLSEIDPDHMREYVDPDGQQMMDRHRFMCHLVCGDAIVNWLWAYWQGRVEGVIDSSVI